MTDAMRDPYTIQSCFDVFMQVEDGSIRCENGFTRRV